MSLSQCEVEALVAQIRDSPKYRALDLCPETVRDLIVAELPKHRRSRDAVKAARKKLHEVVALYIGDPDYSAARARVAAGFAAGDLRPACAEIMQAHTSTRERLATLGEFYATIFAVTGKPGTILDLACGLNPLALAWLGVGEVDFYAYDIHQARVAFLAEYFARQRELTPGLRGYAVAQDILLEHPTQEADVALVLKEIPRFEKRQAGITAPLLDALRVRWIVATVPAHNLTGHHDLRDTNRRMMQGILGQRAWTVTEIEFPSELCLVIDKGAAG